MQFFTLKSTCIFTISKIFTNNTYTEKKVLNLLRLTEDFGLNLATLCISA